LFEAGGETLYSDRNIIKRFSLDESDEILRNVIVKRYKYPNFFQRIAYSFFRKTKAERAFYNAGKLRSAAISTPREIAYLKQWHRGLFGYGFFVSGADDAPPICDRLIELDPFDRVMADDFASFAIKLHEAGILDHDLNSTNVLYHAAGAQYHFSLIDINRIDFMPKGKPISRDDCLENLTRFTRKMDLFEYVIRCYAEKRNWDISSTLNRAIKIKRKHDRQRKHRKAFLRALRRLCFRRRRR